MPDAAASTHDQDPEDPPVKQTISLVLSFNQDAFLSHPKAPDDGDHVPVLYLAEQSSELRSYPAARDSDGWNDAPDADTIQEWQNWTISQSCLEPLTVLSYTMYNTDNPVAIDVQTLPSTSFVIVKTTIRALHKRFILNSGWSSVSSRLQPSRSCQERRTSFYSASYYLVGFHDRAQDADNTQTAPTFFVCTRNCKIRITCDHVTVAQEKKHSILFPASV